MEYKIDQDLNIQVSYKQSNSAFIKLEAAKEATASTTVVTTDASGDTGGETYSEVQGGVPGDVPGMAVKDPLLSNWIFVIGITAITLAISIAIGILLAKRKIKKGYELYED